MSSTAVKIISKNFKEIQDNPMEGIAVVLDQSNMLHWDVYLEAPKDTPYAGGIFHVTLDFPADFPMSPPEAKFVSDIWHMNGLFIPLKSPSLSSLFFCSSQFILMEDFV